MSKLPEEIIAKIKTTIKENPHLLSSAVSIITMGFQLMRQENYKDVPTIKATLLDVLEKVAKGPDGVIGTADDVIPRAVMEEAIILLQTNMASDFITAIIGNSILEVPQSVKKLSCFCL